jgi:hypothetical protein
VEWLDDLDDEPDDRVRREELTTESPFGHSEVREEVLVNQPERVAGQLAWQRGKQAEQFGERRPLESLITARQDVAQLGVCGLDHFHRRIDGGSEIIAFWQVHESGEAGLGGHEENGASPVVVRGYGIAGRRLRLELRPGGVEAVLGVSEEDQPEHGPPVVGGGERRVSPQLVRGLPQGPPDLS